MTFEGISTFQDLLQIFDQPFENIAVAFKGKVPEQKRFEAACALMALLEDGELQANERVVALYILYNLYNVVPIHQNPFLILFLNLYKALFSNLTLIKTNNDMLVEFRVEAMILADKGSQLADKSPVDVYKQFTHGDNSLIIDTEEINVAEFEYYLKQEFDVQLPSKEESPESRHDDSTRPWSWAAIDELDVSESSYAPTRTPDIQHELHRLGIHDNEQDIEQDYDLITEFTSQDESRALMDKALQRALTIPEEEYILGQFEKNDKLVYQCDLSPEKLPDLVENNPRIAVEALLQLKTSPQVYKQIKPPNRFLNMLVAINDPERSQQSSMEPVSRMRSSMEVVNQLTTSFPLLPEFLHKYLSNCVRACEESQNRNIQDRQVRLSLIRNNIIDVNRFFIEIQAFCLQFSRIREAAGLFRFLLDLQRNSVVDNAVLNVDIV
ncbi:1668_t:CDS:2 [Funneliformis caledonium]|uniref:CCR4-NOT transcription complex subunit 11 n=1 Tax=Funneliformis caledonium TaxID=1117310 RepID=A0A9N9BN41_9GLOM|nr:1668_t:CDS:2 [Funneliformis caledonium]